MNYHYNSYIIKYLINQRLANEKDVFTYYSYKFDTWFICSKFIINDEIWSYRITKNQNNNIIGSLTYFSLSTSYYENNYGHFDASIGDLRKFNAILNRKINYKKGAILVDTILKEHRIAIRHKRPMIDVKALTI